MSMYDRVKAFMGKRASVPYGAIMFTLFVLSAFAIKIFAPLF